MTDDEKLRDLADRWRYEHAQRAGSAGKLETAYAFEQCAEELDALLDGAEQLEGEL